MFVVFSQSNSFVKMNDSDEAEPFRLIISLMIPTEENSVLKQILTLTLLFAGMCMARAGEVSIERFGAKGDGETINTVAIQTTIDKVAAAGGGTVVIPKGEFVSGALFLKPGVNLHLNSGAVLQCSTDMKNFPEQRTRIEGHFEEHFNPALINADGCDGLVIDGDGTLDGAGRPIWDAFWKHFNADKNFKNLDQPRARLALIENSKNVTVRGITFKDSQFWNLHLYNCEQVLVESARFEVPDDYKQAPSSDGIDVDSCHDVVISKCFFSVTDDCIAMKGSKGPFALEDKSSPPVENVRISDCEFLRGHHMLACGSEATIVRDVVVENCVVKGAMPMFRAKLRPDTPQCYENITFRDIEFENSGAWLFEVAPWTQYFDLKGQPAPSSTVRNITVSGIKGTIKYLGKIEGHATATISGIILEDVDVEARKAELRIRGNVKNVVTDNVKVNGSRFTLNDD